jgi:hypothetical protein
VPATQNGANPFQSMITFNEGGTISEVSNELGLGLQGPAHGAWAETDDGTSRRCRHGSSTQTLVLQKDVCRSG